MFRHFKNLTSYVLIILASISVGVIVAHPIAPRLMNECLYNQVTSTYIPGGAVDDQWNKCLLQPQMVAVAVTVFTTFLLALWFRRTLLDETPVKQLAVSSIIYGLLQFLSLILLQSHYLYDIQRAFTFGEIVRSYWFAIGAIVYYLIAVIITSLLLNKRDQ